MGTRGTVTDLDPGIAPVVQWLQKRGFETTDSGDGVSKAELIAAGEALPYPHVAAVVDPSNIAEEAERMWRTLTLHEGVGFGKGWIVHSNSRIPKRQLSLGRVVQRSGSGEGTRGSER